MYLLMLLFFTDYYCLRMLFPPCIFSSDTPLYKYFPETTFRKRRDQTWNLLNRNSNSNSNSIKRMGVSLSHSASVKMKQGCASDKELLRRIRELQSEMMVEREKQRRAYEGKVREREAEWHKERRILEEQVRKLRHSETATSDCRRDETAERWKKLYNVIKAELDDLIQRTQNSGSLMYNVNMLQYLERELRWKENTIEALKAKIIDMEKEESKKAREVDILRQSLRIIMNNSKSSKSAHLMKTSRSLSRLQDRSYSDFKSTGTNNMG